MAFLSDRMRKAYDIAFDERGLDMIYDSHETPKFVEVIGSIGGDAITLRIYDNGMITER